MPKLELVTPESFIVDAAKPLLHVVDQMIDYPRVKEDVAKARKHIEKAMRLLDRAYSDLR